MKTIINVLAALTLSLGAFYVPTQVQAAKHGGNGECSSGQCGTPNQSGGGCGCGCGSILIAMTDRGDTYQFADDFDGDGIEDEYDNCPFAANFSQADADADGVGDGCDVCQGTSDPDQMDTDANGQGDACDPDIDGDNVLNAVDNCPTVRNGSQEDNDKDGMTAGGDACDADDDNDGIDDVEDNCRLIANTDQNLVNTGCEDDTDGDTLNEFDAAGNILDNCPTVSNIDQSDIDQDGKGDSCDTDMDGDGVFNWEDNCVGVSNPMQLDFDHDGKGDAGQWNGGAASCDSQECYEVGQGNSCLNPNSAFNVQLGLDPVLAGGQIKTGQEVVVYLFTNRLGLTHQWEARFNNLPAASDTFLENARSVGTTLGNFAEVAQPVGDGFNRISFVPDAAGEYQVSVKVELPNGDPSNLQTTVSTQTITVNVAEGGSGGGCAAGAGSGVVGVALGLVALVRRRRRK